MIIINSALTSSAMSQEYKEGLFLGDSVYFKCRLKEALRKIYRSCPESRSTQHVRETSKHARSHTLFCAVTLGLYGSSI